MLPEQNQAGYTPAQIMMTLAAISYAAPSEISNELANPAYATRAGWNVVWGPVDTIDGVYVDNLVYVAQYTGANIYAIVIRGTVLAYSLSTLVDLYEDLEVSNPVPWVYPLVPNALVASGTLFGLEIMTNMVDGPTGQTLLEFFSSVSSAFIYVTGHSLGGCLTTVLAPWLLYQFEQNDINQAYILPYTFAAPTAGNHAFANWYNGRFTVATERYFNSIDAIPMAWNNLYGITYLFPNGPPCPWAMDAVVDLVTGWLYAVGVSYAQTNDPDSALPGTSTQSADWFTEIGIQHDHNTYLKLLGAPPVDIITIIEPPLHGAVLLLEAKPV